MPVFPGSEEERFLVDLKELSNTKEKIKELKRKARDLEHRLAKDYCQLALSYDCVKIGWRKLAHRLKV